MNEYIPILIVAMTPTSLINFYVLYASYRQEGAILSFESPPSTQPRSDSELEEAVILGHTHKQFLKQPSDRFRRINDWERRLEIGVWDNRMGMAPPYLIRNYKGLPQRPHAVST